MVAGGPSSAVSVAEGEEASGEAVFLDAFPPPPDHGCGVRVGVIVVVEVDKHLRAIDPLPNEGVVGEGIAATVGPEDLMGGEVLDAAAPHDLGQGTRVPEDVGEPEELTVDAELLLEKALPV